MIMCPNRLTSQITFGEVLTSVHFIVWIVGGLSVEPRTALTTSENHLPIFIVHSFWNVI